MKQQTLFELPQLTWLYIAASDTGLLKLGITDDPHTRITTHRHDKQERTLHYLCGIEYPTRAEAYRQEAHLIAYLDTLTDAERVDGHREWRRVTVAGMTQVELFMRRQGANTDYLKRETSRIIEATTHNAVTWHMREDDLA